MKKLLSRQDAADTGMDDLRSVLSTATTQDMRHLLVQNAFDTERELTVNLLAAAIWDIDFTELSRVCGISLDAAKAIQEMTMKEIAILKVPNRR